MERAGRFGRTLRVLFGRFDQLVYHLHIRHILKYVYSQIDHKGAQLHHSDRHISMLLDDCTINSETDQNHLSSVSNSARFQSLSYIRRANYQDQPDRAHSCSQQEADYH